MACETVWDALGDPVNYVEPFAGSAAMLLGRPNPGNVETINDADGFVCLAPDTRLLDGDLRWVLAGEVQVGQQLVGFDEENGPARPGFRAPTSYRHWRHTEVTAVRRVVKPCYRLTFDDGTTVVASEDHLWLGGSHKSGGAGGGRGWRWQKTSGLVCNRATQKSWILKLCDVTEQEKTYDAGWLSGFYDGEGHLRNAPGWRVGVTQKIGPEADRVETLLRARGFDVSRQVRKNRCDKHQPCAHFELNGGMRETLRFLMQVRPERLIQKFKGHIESMSLYGRSHQAVGLVSKEFLGDREVVAIETASHTFIAEGLASHNCNFWRAVSYDPDAVTRHADWPCSEADLEARHAWLVNRSERLRWQLEDPDFYDAKVAGWWVWGACNWIGSGWCAGKGPHLTNGVRLFDSRKLPHLGDAGQGINRQLPHLSDAGTGINRQLPHLSAGRGINRQLPHLSAGRGINRQLPHLSAGQGINRQLPHLSAGQGINRQLPHLGNAGRGINRQLPHLGNAGRGINRQLPHLGDAGQGEHPRSAFIRGWMMKLAERLRDVRVTCGDWTRVVTDSVTTRHGMTGVFLDPPYTRGRMDYAAGGVGGELANAVRDWCTQNGENERLRIVLCGHEHEHDELLQHGWHLRTWTARKGYAVTDEAVANSASETLWCSPHCVGNASTRQAALFAV